MMYFCFNFKLLKLNFVLFLMKKTTCRDCTEIGSCDRCYEVTCHDCRPGELRIRPSCPFIFGRCLKVNISFDLLL